MNEIKDIYIALTLTGYNGAKNHLNSIYMEVGVSSGAIITTYTTDENGTNIVPCNSATTADIFKIEGTATNGEQFTKYVTSTATAEKLGYDQAGVYAISPTSDLLVIKLDRSLRLIDLIEQINKRTEFNVFIMKGFNAITLVKNKLINNET